MIIRLKNRILFLLLTIFIVLAVLLFCYPIPLSNVVKALRAPQQINQIYVEIDRGTAEYTFFRLNDDAITQTFLDQLANIRVRYCGSCPAIPYGEYENDWIIILHLNGSETAFSIRSNGELYANKIRYREVGNDVRILYELILEMESSKNPSGANSAGVFNVLSFLRTGR